VRNITVATAQMGVPPIYSIRPRDRGFAQELGVRVRVAHIDGQWSGIPRFLRLTEFIGGTGMISTNLEGIWGMSV